MRFDDNQSIDISAMANTDILPGTDVSTGTDKKFTLANLASWILTRFSIPHVANLAAAAGTLLGMVRANNITGGANRNGWTALTSGQDLDDLTTPGVYYATSAIMASVVNAPYTGQCKVVVENTYANANNIQQTVMPGNATNVTYTRRGTNVTGSSATWSDWNVVPTGAEVGEVANLGAKNLAPNDATTATVSGVTFTVNADGTIKANGTATANLSFNIFSKALSALQLSAGQRIIMSGAEGGSTATYRLQLRRNSTEFPSGSQYDAAVTTTVPAAAVETDTITFRIYAASGTVFDSVVFYPMLRPASITDDTYTPYAMTNAELTAAIKALQGA